MFKPGSTFLFSVAGTLTSLFALHLSQTIAVLLLPHDVLHQSLFTLPIFLLTSAAFMLLVGKHLGAKPDQPSKARLVTATLAINIFTVAVMILLIYSGVATPLEALILGGFVLFGCLTIYKHFSGRNPHRHNLHFQERPSRMKIQKGGRPEGPPPST